MDLSPPHLKSLPAWTPWQDTLALSDRAQRARMRFLFTPLRAPALSAAGARAGLGPDGAARERPQADGVDTSPDPRLDRGIASRLADDISEAAQMAQAERMGVHVPIETPTLSAAGAMAGLGALGPSSSSPKAVAVASARELTTSVSKVRMGAQKATAMQSTPVRAISDASGRAGITGKGVIRAAGAGFEMRAPKGPVAQDRERWKSGTTDRIAAASKGLTLANMDWGDHGAAPKPQPKRTWVGKQGDATECPDDCKEACADLAVAPHSAVNKGAPYRELEKERVVSDVCPPLHPGSGTLATILGNDMRMLEMARRVVFRMWAERPFRGQASRPKPAWANAVFGEAGIGSQSKSCGCTDCECKERGNSVSSPTSSTTRHELRSLVESFARRRGKDGTAEWFAPVFNRGGRLMLGAEQRGPSGDPWHPDVNLGRQSRDALVATVHTHTRSGEFSEQDRRTADALGVPMVLIAPGVDQVRVYEPTPRRMRNASGVGDGRRARTVRSRAWLAGGKNRVEISGPSGMTPAGAIPFPFPAADPVDDDLRDNIVLFARDYRLRDLTSEQILFLAFLRLQRPISLAAGLDHGLVKRLVDAARCLQTKTPREVMSAAAKGQGIPGSTSCQLAGPPTWFLLVSIIDLARELRSEQDPNVIMGHAVALAPGPPLTLSDPIPLDPWVIRAIMAIARDPIYADYYDPDLDPDTILKRALELAARTYEFFGAAAKTEAEASADFLPAHVRTSGPFAKDWKIPADSKSYAINDPWIGPDDSVSYTPGTWRERRPPMYESIYLFDTPYGLVGEGRDVPCTNARVTSFFAPSQGSEGLTTGVVFPGPIPSDYSVDIPHSFSVQKIVRYVHGSCWKRIPWSAMFRTIGEKIDELHPGIEQGPQSDLRFQWGEIALTALLPGLGLALSSEADPISFLVQPHFTSEGDGASWGIQIGAQTSTHATFFGADVSDTLVVFKLVLSLVPDRKNFISVRATYALGDSPDADAKQKVQQSLDAKVPALLSKLGQALAEPFELAFEDIAANLNPTAPHPVLNGRQFSCGPLVGEIDCFNQFINMIATSQLGIANQLTATGPAVVDMAALQLRPENFVCKSTTTCRDVQKTEYSNGHYTTKTVNECQNCDPLGRTAVCKFRPILQAVNILPQGLELVFAPDLNPSPPQPPLSWVAAHPDGNFPDQTTPRFDFLGELYQEFSTLIRALPGGTPIPSGIAASPCPGVSQQGLPSGVEPTPCDAIPSTGEAWQGPIYSYHSGTAYSQCYP